MSILAAERDNGSKHGFTPSITPSLVKPEAMEGTGFLGAHAAEVYRLEAELSVIGWPAAALPALGFLVMVKIAIGRTASIQAENALELRADAATRDDATMTADTAVVAGHEGQMEDRNVAVSSPGYTSSSGDETPDERSKRTRVVGGDSVG